MAKSKEDNGGMKMKGKINEWKIGSYYVIRTVTMIDVGRLVKITPNEIILDNACWIADTGRWNEFLKNGTYNESEPFPEGIVIIGRNSLIDATLWKHGQVKEVK